MSAVASAPTTHEDRARIVRRGLVLNYLTLGYNAVEAIVSIAAGVVSGSVALVGFGIDSAIEVTAAGAAQWRLRADLTPSTRSRVEGVAVRIVGWSFIALALYVVIDAAIALWTRDRASRSVPGIAILAASVIVMPVLARAKRRVSTALGSRTLHADAMQTSLCAWLSAIALTGVLLDATLGWWWADPVAALAMVPIIVREATEGIRGEDHCADCR